MVSIQCLETAGIYTAQYIPRADYSAPRRTDYSRATRQYQFGTARPRYAVYTPFYRRLASHAEFNNIQFEQEAVNFHYRRVINRNALWQLSLTNIWTFNGLSGFNWRTVPYLIQDGEATMGGGIRFSSSAGCYIKCHNYSSTGKAGQLYEYLLGG